MNQRVSSVIEAFAVGDAMGMPTEFMTRKSIYENFGLRVNTLIPSHKSQNHSNLPCGTVTDDTEQNLYLLKAYMEEGEVTVDTTVKKLIQWINETDAIGKKYIGPSSLKALKAIEDGADPEIAGREGTTCGGIMRTPSVVLFNTKQNTDELLERIIRCLLPTHNTSQAFEAAGAYGFALHCALNGGSMEEIFNAALEGGIRAMERAPYIACAPSSSARIRYARRCCQLNEEELYELLFDLWGTGLPSADVCGAVFAIFAYAGKDVWKAIRIGASVGGDTDTIAALVGALCTAYAGSHNIPQDIRNKVLGTNRELLSPYFIEV